MAFEAALKPDERSISNERPVTDAWAEAPDPGRRLDPAPVERRHPRRSTLPAGDHDLCDPGTGDVVCKELAFLPHVLRPGMTAIDIGANLGIYSLAMARLVAPGKVFAFEPASEPRALLERSESSTGRRTSRNLCGRVIGQPARRPPRVRCIERLNALADAGPGERVRITTLDLEEARQGWHAPDFVKIDAEGEEERVSRAAPELAHHSPLVIFEVKPATWWMGILLSIFPALGSALPSLRSSAARSRRSRRDIDQL